MCLPVLHEILCEKERDRERQRGSDACFYVDIFIVAQQVWMQAPAITRKMDGVYFGVTYSPQRFFANVSNLVFM